MRDERVSSEFRYAQLLTRPHIAVLAGSVLSFIAWALPPLSFAGKGFVAAPTTTTEMVRTVAAYMIIAGFCAAGFYLGRPLGRRIRSFDEWNPVDLRNGSVWTLWILLAAAGVLGAAAKVVNALGVRGCIHTIVTFNANAFKGAIYADYSVGLLTLRYVAILAAAIAVFRYLAFKEISIRSVLSLVLLLIVALISSRLSIVWAVVIGATTYLLSPEQFGKRRIAVGEIAVWMAIIFAVIGTLTISRTFGYYRERGADTVFAAVGSEFQRYLAAPFQGSIEAVNHPRQRSRLSDEAGIDGSLTTNSALLEFAVFVGKWNVIALGMVLFSSGLACGLLDRFKSTYLITAYGVLQCCHFEIWRLSMFQRGITITLLGTLLIVTLSVAYIQIPSLRLPSVRIRLS
jgi:hypothetical protein